MREFCFWAFTRPKNLTYVTLPPLFKAVTKGGPCHDFWHAVMFVQPWHCNSWKEHFRQVAKCCACHERAKRCIAKCCACQENTTRLHCYAYKILRLGRKLRKLPPALKKTSISYETSFNFHTSETARNSSRSFLAGHCVKDAKKRRRCEDDARARRPTPRAQRSNPGPQL